MAGPGSLAALLALPAGMSRGGELVPQQGGGTVTYLLVTLGQLIASSLCRLLPAAWAGLELPGWRWLSCEPCVPRHSLGAGNTVDVKGMSGAAQGSLWGGRSWMTAVGWGVAHSTVCRRETEAQWLHPGAGGAVPGWSGHSTSREGGRADGDRDNAENTPVALLPVTMARGIFSCCGLSDRTASPVQLLPHPALSVAGPPWPSRAAPGAVETVTLETKHKHLTRCHPRLSN